MKDAFGSMWWSKGEGIGAWMQVIFKGLFIITRWEVTPRGNALERNKIMELEFSDGTKQRFTILNNSSVQNFPVAQVHTSYVIVKIIEVYGTINNGGSFNFFGMECKNLGIPEKESKEANGLLRAAGLNPNEIPSLYEIDNTEVVGVGCRDSFVNSKKFKFTKMDENNFIIINCFNSCSLSSYLIYGNEKYTKDSAICKSAFHSKKISALGGKVIL
jgi:hypothetical protein